ncbi:MAG: DUF3592 domain-containing protein [Planctomycetota bacterium]
MADVPVSHDAPAGDDARPGESEPINPLVGVVPDPPRRPASGELVGAAPHRVVFGLLGLCLAAVFLLFMQGSHPSALDSVRLDLFAQTAPGTLIDVQQHEGWAARTDRNRFGSERYVWRTATYRFKVSGRVVQAEGLVFGDVEIDSAVSVEYLPEAPHISRLADIGTNSVYRVGSWAGVGLLVLSALALLTAVRPMMQHRRMLTYGEVVNGTITSIDRRNESRVARIHYEYRAPGDGRTLTGSALSKRASLAGWVGAPITLVVDAARPARHVAVYASDYPFVGGRRARRAQRHSRPPESGA